MPIDLSKIKAIDVHVHAEISCHDPEDPVMGQFFDAAELFVGLFEIDLEAPAQIAVTEDQILPGTALHIDAAFVQGLNGGAQFDRQGTVFTAFTDQILQQQPAVDRHPAQQGDDEDKADQHALEKGNPLHMLKGLLTAEICKATL